MLVLVQVGGDGLDVAGVGLQPLVVVRRDAEAEDVDGLRLAAEARGQLLGDEHVGPVGELEHAVDRVVVGDRHEVHAPPLGERIDLFGRVAHSGRPSARWTPSFETSEADEWQCRSARLMWPRMPCKSAKFVNLAVPQRERDVNACWPVRNVNCGWVREVREPAARLGRVRMSAFRRTRFAWGC